MKGVRLSVTNTTGVLSQRTTKGKCDVGTGEPKLYGLVNYFFFFGTYTSIRFSSMNSLISA